MSTATEQLTREQILAMPAGPEMNRIVGETFGLAKDFRCPKCGGYQFTSHDGEQVWCRTEDSTCKWVGTWADVEWPDYSSNVGLAWLVLEQLPRFKWWALTDVSMGTGEPFVAIHRWNGQRVMEGADTVPLAICRTALIAIL